jgi:hypothetical protein
VHLLCLMFSYVHDCGFRSTDFLTSLTFFIVMFDLYIFHLLIFSIFIVSGLMKIFHMVSFMAFVVFDV